MLKRAVFILTSAVALFAFLCSTVSFLRNEKIETIFIYILWNNMKWNFRNCFVSLFVLVCECWMVMYVFCNDYVL